MAALGVDDAPAKWREAWDAHPFPGAAPFLSEAAVGEALDFCAFPEDVAGALCEAAARARGDARLAGFAWLLHHAYFDEPRPAGSEVFGWPNVAKPLLEYGAMVPALVLLSGVPGLRAMHAARGIPEGITRETLYDIVIWNRHFRRLQGYWGLQNMGWPTNHFAGRLVRLGRLQFMHVNDRSALRVFKHRDGRVVALTAPDITFRRDGYVDGTNEISDPEAWQSTFELREDAAVGQPIDRS